MGVIYKLKPEIREYLLQARSKDSALGCRMLVSLVKEKFGVKVSKSGISEWLKENSLSMPVGRRIRPRRGTIETVSLGTVFLKAADQLLGGTHNFSEAVNTRLKYLPEAFQAKLECLLYRPLFNNFSSGNLVLPWKLGGLIYQGVADHDITLFINKLRSCAGLSEELVKLVKSSAQEVPYLKVNLPQPANIYLDSQFHTIWSSPKIPQAFSLSSYSVLNNVNKNSEGNLAVTLFMAPGYDSPSQDFFSLLVSSTSASLEPPALPQNQKLSLIFGVWPWQFGHCMVIKEQGEFKSFYFEPLKKAFNFAPVEVELSQPQLNKQVMLKGCVLKDETGQDFRLFILTNDLSGTNTDLKRFLGIYLDCWPNLEETFQDFSHKVELSLAKTNALPIPSGVNFSNQAAEDVTVFFEEYLKFLDSYVKDKFFPPGFEDKDFPTMKEHIYSLPGILKRHKNHTCLTLRPGQKFPFLKELKYACHRLNENKISLFDEKKLWFLI